MSVRTKDVRHVRSTKEKPVKTFMCRRDGCGAVFSTASNRSKHERRSCRSTAEIQTRIQTPIQCDRCRKKFSRRYCLQRHQLYSCHQAGIERTVDTAGIPTFSDSETDDEEIPYTKSLLREADHRTTEVNGDIVAGSPEPIFQFILSDCLNTCHASVLSE